MIREKTTERPNWRQRLSDRAFTDVENSSPMPYWSEDVCYKFTAAQIDEIEAAADELHARCLDAVQHIIDKDLFHRFGISGPVKDYIIKSWNRRDPDIYGRFDFAYDGVNPPKMLEYNADTPTSLYEASVLQWDWLMDKKLPDQFNSIHERLVDKWKEVNKKYTVAKPFYFAAFTESVEDLITTEYMRGTAEEAGIKTKALDIGEIGWNGEHFTDLEENRIGGFWKLYPWEWMAEEEFGQHAVKDNTAIAEPVWNMLLSNKAILPILWEMFPDHPNLLPAYDTPDKLKGEAYVKKPILGREGASVEIITPDFNEAVEGPYGKEGYIYQKYTPLPDFNGNHPVLGVWVVGEKSCGMGIRESQGSKITTNTCRFMPHYFTPS